MLPIVTFQNVEQTIKSIEDFAVELDKFDAVTEFELWLCLESGPAVCMLRKGTNAWLMYLRHSDDDGVTSEGASRVGTVNYQLANGQIDQYPATWCVPVEICYKALAYFFVNEGQRAEFLNWRQG